MLMPVECGGILGTIFALALFVRTLVRWIAHCLHWPGGPRLQ